MSGMIDNKNQIIHIACEVIVLFGIVYYVNYKNKKLLRTIESLAQRIEEQDDLIVRLEDLIKAQTSQILQIQAVVSKLASEQLLALPKQEDIKIATKENTKKNVTSKNNKPKPKSKINEEMKPKLIEKPPPPSVQEDDAETDTEDDEDEIMDEEISNELQELEDSLTPDPAEQNENIEELDITDTTDLKKKDL
jgi:hypothetical protein